MRRLTVVRTVPGPDVRRLEQRGDPIVARALLDGVLAIPLAIGTAQPVRREVGGVPGDVMAVFVIDDARVVRGVRPVAPPGGVDQGAVLEQLPPEPEVHLAIRRERLVLRAGVLAGPRPAGGAP